MGLQEGVSFRINDFKATLKHGGFIMMWGSWLGRRRALKQN